MFVSHAVDSQSEYLQLCNSAEDGKFLGVKLCAGKIHAREVKQIWQQGQVCSASLYALNKASKVPCCAQP
jgi:hypothetical protein